MNVFKAVDLLSDFFSPKVVAEIEDMFVKVARIKGDKIPWHSHENEDELFYILDGELVMELEGKDAFKMREGDLFVVPKNVSHRIYSDDECRIMLIERKSTAHTGKQITAITKSIDEQISG